MSYERRYLPIGREGQFSIGELDDVTLDSLADNDILVYNSSTSMWENEPGTLENLDDTNITTPATGEVLSWDGTDWINTPDFTLGISSLADGEVLQYASGSGTWQNVSVATLITTVASGDWYPAQLGHAGI